MTPRLTTLQRDLLDAFFARTQSLFLTGGGTLVVRPLRALAHAATPK